MHNCSSVKMKKIMSFIFNINWVSFEIGSLFMCDCIVQDSVMVHEELCSPFERIISQKEKEYT